MVFATYTNRNYFELFSYATFGQPCDFRVYAKCMQKCMQLVFRKIRGSKGNLNKWGVLLPGAPNRASLNIRQQ